MITRDSKDLPSKAVPNLETKMATKEDFTRLLSNTLASINEQLA
jgi:hypothetical protein